VAKILLLEDQSFIAKIIERALATAGHAVTWHRNGRAGLEAFATDRPDLLITDIIMPEVDGLEVIRAVRAQDRNLPIIAISGGGDREDFEFLETAQRLGATEVIRKPISREQLLTAINRCLEILDP
jgi:CheY-like chemotaxis protein